jgi:hypothetical protein
MNNKTQWMAVGFIFIIAASIFIASLQQTKLSNLQHSRSFKGKVNTPKWTKQESNEPGELLVWEIMTRRLLFFTQ